MIHYENLKIYLRLGLKLCKTCKNKKDYLKWKSKPRFMSHKIFDNDLVAIHKIKATLTYIKHAHIGYLYNIPIGNVKNLGSNFF